MGNGIVSAAVGLHVVDGPAAVAAVAGKNDDTVVAGYVPVAAILRSNAASIFHNLQKHAAVGDGAVRRY